MIRRLYICNVANKVWGIGQYFIVDEDREFFIPARIVPIGERGASRLEAVGQIELNFDYTIAPYVLEIGNYTGGEIQDDRSIILS
jgi:hypothetical protein